MTDLVYRPFGAFRLILAFLVVQQHFLSEIVPTNLMQATIGYEVGGVAVLAFFALSGFVICEAADKIYANRPVDFIANRALRIVPLFVLVAVMTIFIYLILSHFGILRFDRSGKSLPFGTLNVSNIALNLIGFTPFTNRMMTYDFLDVAWTLRTETLFYIILGLSLYWSCSMRRFGWPSWTLGRTSVVIAIATAPLYVLAVLRWAPETFTLAPYFWFGGALYFATVKRAPVAAWMVVISVAAIAWEFLSRPSEHRSFGFEREVYAQSVLLAVLLCGIVILSFARASKHWKIDSFLGNITYSLYLSHQVVMVVVLSLTNGHSLSAYLFALTLSILVAVALHACIEPPINRVRDMVRNGRSSVQTGTRFELRAR